MFGWDRLVGALSRDDLFAPDVFEIGSTHILCGGTDRMIGLSVDIWRVRVVGGKQVLPDEAPPLANSRHDRRCGTTLASADNEFLGGHRRCRLPSSVTPGRRQNGFARSLVDNPETCGV